MRALPVFSSLLLFSISILGSIAQTLDFPSWSVDTPRSTKLPGFLSSANRGDARDETRAFCGAVKALAVPARAIAATVARRVMVMVCLSVGATR